MMRRYQKGRTSARNAGHISESVGLAQSLATVVTVRAVPRSNIRRGTDMNLEKSDRGNLQAVLGDEE